ncbi:MAG TPA: DUF2585 family protein [Kofleriaceae bacterium]|nr:DUF2585 family protein [Kofleriaceae bacterium]
MSRNAAAVYLVALAALTAGVLALFGRNLWCAVGDLWPWSWETASAHNSQHLLDPYSFTHFEHGLLFYAGLRLVAPRAPLRVRLLAALTLAAGWEVLENSDFIIDRYREQTVDAGYYGDSVLNSLADMGWCALGFAVASTVKWWWSVAIMVAFEVTLALTIRDNLFLNILMLVYPFEGVLAWQSAR